MGRRTKPAKAVTSAGLVVMEATADPGDRSLCSNSDKVSLVMCKPDVPRTQTVTVGFWTWAQSQNPLHMESIMFNTFVAKLRMGWLCAALMLTYWLIMLKRCDWGMQRFYSDADGSDRKWLRQGQYKDLQQHDIARGTPHKCKRI